MVMLANLMFAVCLALASKANFCSRIPAYAFATVDLFSRSTPRRGGPGVEVGAGTAAVAAVAAEVATEGVTTGAMTTAVPAVAAEAAAAAVPGT